MSDLKISVIIPAYNEEKYLGTCLDSVLKNVGDKIHEIIVVDNASSDNTSNIAKSYQNVKVFYEDKKGVMNARQRGYIESTGDLIAYLDADTKMSADWYDIVIKEFSSNSNLACLSGRVSYYDGSFTQNILGFVFWFFSMPVYYFVGYMAIFSNLIIRKNVVDKMGGLDTSITFYGDDTNTARRAKAFGISKFKFNFVMPVSARRLAKNGLLKSGIVYIINFFSEVINKKPFSNDHIDIR